MQFVDGGLSAAVGGAGTGLVGRSIKGHGAGLRIGPGVSRPDFLQLGDMGLQFIEVGPADEVQADHLQSP